jgi:signal transduction histidine kinase
MQIAQVVVPEHLALANEVTARQLLGETVPPYKLEILTKEGRRVPLELHSRLLRHEGQPLGIQGIARDISERKRGEEILQHATAAAQAANRAKSEFLATMSHELRTPLTVILGYTDLLLEETFGTLSNEQAHPLRRIYCNARELLDLITAVLDVSRLEAGRLPLAVQAVELPALLEEVKAETQGVQEQSALDFV